MSTDSKCVKCGGYLRFPKYHANNKACEQEVKSRKLPQMWNSDEEEHLHYYCGCGYDQVEDIE